MYLEKQEQIDLFAINQIIVMQQKIPNKNFITGTSKIIYRNDPSNRIKIKFSYWYEPLEYKRAVQLFYYAD